jgi:hypothetical protein
MTIFYSKATKGFYDDQIHGNIPADAVEVSDELHASLLAAQATGKIIQADANGNPIAADPPAATGAELWAAHQGQAQTALSDADVTMTRIMEAVALGSNSWTSPDVVAFVNYRRSLRAVLSSPTGDPTQSLPTKPAFPSGT